MPEIKLSVRVLLVEDDEEDYLITKNNLNHIERTEFILDWVMDYDSAVKELSKKNHDVYLIDYMLGADDGLDLIQEAKKLDNANPIIILTGQKNHNTDMKAMELGAYDYLIKDDVSPEAIERSIRYSLERKKLEKQLKEQNDLLSLIYNTVPVGICLVDYECNIVNSNKTFLKLFNMTEKEIFGKKFKEIMTFRQFKEDIYENDLQEENYCCQEKICRLCKEEMFEPIEGRFILKNGKELNAIISTGKLIHKNGKTQEFRLVTVVDIGKQKLAEDMLIDTVKNTQELIRKYGIETKNADVMLDLCDLELSKMEHNLLKVSKV